MNNPLPRVAGAVAVLALFHAVLLEQPPAEELAPGSAALDRTLVASRDAFAGGRFEEALEPTLALVEAMPGQPMFLERLAVIYQELGRPAEEARTWDEFVDASATPEILHTSVRIGFSNDQVSVPTHLVNHHPVRAFSYGITHDAARLGLIEIVPGFSVANANAGAGPVFFNPDISPASGAPFSAMTALISEWPVFHMIGAPPRRAISSNSAWLALTSAMIGLPGWRARTSAARICIS